MKGSERSQHASISRKQQSPLSDGGKDRLPAAKRAKRVASVYDAVAGRLGLNGFLSLAQLHSSNINPLTPEEVLFRRVSAPTTISHDFYAADERLPSQIRLPDSDLLKAVHSYTSDFYHASTHNQGQHDLKSFDGTALLAVGILLEEAMLEVLGETGDMALVEPSGLDKRLPESRMVVYQVRGTVKPPPTPEYVSEESEDAIEEETRPRKKRARRYLDTGE